MAEKRTAKGGRCIFCGNGSLTKEHVWPHWLRRYIPVPAHLNTLHGRLDLEISSSRFMMSPIKRGSQSRPGHTTSRRLRVVCNRCNNRWMSQLQNAAKPLLLELFEQRCSISSNDERLIVSNWITMFTMVSEFLSPDNVGISETDRQTFYRTLEPLPNWSIWLAWHNSEHVEGVKPEHGTIHHAALARKDAQQQRPAWDSQVTTAICGRMLFQVFSTSASNLQIDANFWSSSNKISILHPSSGGINPPPKVFDGHAWRVLDQKLAEYATSRRGAAAPQADPV
jgi:hypothetical protein